MIATYNTVVGAREVPYQNDGSVGANYSVPIRVKYL